MAKKRKTPKRKAAKKPPADWDTLFADSVLDVVAGEKGEKPEVDGYETMLSACSWVREAVGRLSAKMKENSGWSFRLRQEQLSAHEALFHLLLVDDDSGAIIERLAHLNLAAHLPGKVRVLQVGGPRETTFGHKDFEDGLSAMLLKTGSTLRELLVWKLRKQQGSRDDDEEDD
jgi:hypothetical protein